MVDTNIPVDSTGKTLFDFLYIIWLNWPAFFIIILFLIALLLGSIIYFILHPKILIEWNLIITEKIAKYQPKKRKQSFENKLKNTISSSVNKFDNEFASFKKTIFPYHLKLQWISADDNIEPIFEDKQAIIYVNDYTDEVKQAVTIIHTYVSKGFAEKVKFYTDKTLERAIDIIIVKKILQNSKPAILSYYTRDCLASEIKASESIKIAYSNFSKIDQAGLFIPILMNELDKYCSNMYPLDADNTILRTMKNLILFIHSIANKSPFEIVNTKFVENGISIRIILAKEDTVNEEIISDEKINEKDILQKYRYLDNDICNKIITLYIIASGNNIKYADNLSMKIYNHYNDYFDEPKKISFKRYGRIIKGTNAVCYEINKNNFEER